jgi:hypothetical protein
MPLYVGLDLGQAHDFTALAVVESAIVRSALPRPPRVHAVRHLQRFPLGTPYPRIVADVVGLLRQLARLDPRRRLVVDQTGVGRPVVDMLSEALFADGDKDRGDKPHDDKDRGDKPHGSLELVCVTLTSGEPRGLSPRSGSGEPWGLSPRSWRLPKKELVATLQVLLQTRRLHIARALPEAAVLVRELENFRVKITPARHEVFEARRAGQHDDLLLATALAAWDAERTPVHEPVPPPFLGDQRSIIERAPPGVFAR